MTSIGEDSSVAVRTEESQRLEKARDGHFRRALAHALEHAADDAAMEAVVGALATLITDHDDAAAFEMAQTGISALVRRSPGDRKAAGTWHAVSAGCDPNQDAIAIVDLAEEVSRTAFLFTAPSTSFSPTGAAAVAAFRREYLIKRLGSGVVSENALLEWFAKFEAPSAIGGMSTVGIVTRIVHHSRLFGARGGDIEKTRKRVERVVARARKTRK